MNNIDYAATKKEILSLFGVAPTKSFDAKSACLLRINYLKDFLRKTNRKGYVLGISGGVDSTTTGKLCQIACEELRKEGYQAKFYAVRLPHGVQMDENDAQASISFINPDEVFTVNIEESVNAINKQCLNALNRIGKRLSNEDADYHKGNIKARIRMTAQYHFAAAEKLLVISTDHNSEAVTGFYTKYGDGASDLLVLNGLNKRQVRLCAKYLGAPKHLWSKPPTADLEELNPGKLDDEGFGFRYEDLDDFLEGKDIDRNVEIKIINKYHETRFKRDPVEGFKANTL